MDFYKPLLNIFPVSFHFILISLSMFGGCATNLPRFYRTSDVVVQPLLNDSEIAKINSDQTKPDVGFDTSQIGNDSNISSNSEKNREKTSTAPLSESTLSESTLSETIAKISDTISEDSSVAASLITQNVIDEDKQADSKINESKVDESKLNESKINESKVDETKISKTKNSQSFSDLVPVLSVDEWVKNVELAKWIESGMQNPYKNGDPDERKRQASIDRLNQSAKEARKKKENVLEYSPGLISTWRWFHRQLESLSEIPAENNVLLQFLQDDEYAGKQHLVLRANAAILMGRNGDPLAESYLLDCAANKELRVAIRCAAVETLGKMENVSVDVLIPLIELVREREPTVTPNAPPTPFFPGVPSLWAEVLHAAALKLNPWEHPCFIEPFSSIPSQAARSFEVRMETAKIWRSCKPPQLDDGTMAERLPIELREAALSENNVKIRVELLRTLGNWRDPDILSCAKIAMNQGGELRIVAMNSRAAADSQEAVPLIREWLRDSVAANRACAVSALRQLGAFDDIFKMAKDKDASVRTEIAKALGSRQTSQTMEIAKEFLNDSSAVQMETIQAISCWTFDAKAPLLLEGLKSPFLANRTLAANLLAEELPEVVEYNVIDIPKNQTALWNQLKKNMEVRMNEIRESIQTGRVVSPNNQIHSPRLTESTESANIPTAEQEKIWNQWLIALKSPQLEERRRSAAKLQQESRVTTFPKEKLRAIYLESRFQDDALVQTSLLECLKNQSIGGVRRLADDYLASQNPDIRRLACHALRDFGDIRNIPALTNCLHDLSPQVVRAALEAITQILLTESEQHEESDALANLQNTLLEMLLVEDALLQIDTAMTLHALGHSAGHETIRRISFSHDNKIRFYVARSIGSISDPDFVPILIRFLDDPSGSVRQAALVALTNIVGDDLDNVEISEKNDFASPPLSPSQKKTYQLKTWWKNQNNQFIFE
ncbi:MAG: HEAT repeat domain-containing protein [Thermoguttaceae bacterium]